MKFARAVFAIAGIWGVVVTLPLYLAVGFIGRHSPPPITHPEFYFGFVGVVLAWQFVFLLIASDPNRYRPMIVLSVIEKLSYCASNTVLLMLHRISGAQALPAVPDFALLVLFIVSYWRVSGGLNKKRLPAIGLGTTGCW
jgi:hypothetical protein